ncbi:hypothetical protein MNBD_BACTEROID04-430 [hydrothermal vent metagenome]|uniref:Uncharacterized protein n=1 Tax=hydrothermal vent metagenome TaxID=652676 RepID=A0A3B0UGX4_9ZZZZ
MKNFIKITLLLLLLPLVFNSCIKENDFVVNEESASLEDIINVKLIDVLEGKKITVTTNYLKEKWEKEIYIEDDVKVTLDRFEILQSETEEGVKTYFLKAKSTDGTINTGSFILLNKDANGDNIFLLGSKTCSCKGCSGGCELIIDGTRCRCSSCPPGEDCVKTETVIIEDE